MVPLLGYPCVAPLAEAAVRAAAEFVVVEGAPEVWQHLALQTLDAVLGHLDRQARALRERHGKVGARIVRPNFYARFVSVIDLKEGARRGLRVRCVAEPAGLADAEEELLRGDYCL